VTGEQFWMIVNKDLEEEVFDYGILRDKRRPGWIYYDRKEAEDELLKLKMKQPEGEFYLLEAVAEAKLTEDKKGVIWINPIEASFCK
jgi:hypothetical protein